MAILLFVLGLALLIVGAEALVRGAARLAGRVGISPLVIGLTVVAFGTSSPELAVSIKATLDGQANVALGNVVGSNIFNVLFILGFAALITPLVVSRQLIRLDVPLMIGLSVLTLLFVLDGNFSRGNGVLFLVGLVVYVGFLVIQSRRESQALAAVPSASTADATGELDLTAPPRDSWLKNVALIVVGLAMLVLGSRWLVDSAVQFAEYLGVSDLVIGLTIVAAGTSLPEVVTSGIAALRGERDIAVGNVVGSNIFNLLGVLGVAAVLAPDGIQISPAVIGFDIPVMTAVAVACLPIFFSGGMISRWEGGVLLGYYAAYTLYVVLAAAQHDALPLFSSIMLYFVIPITVITILVVVWQGRRADQHR